MSIAALIRNMAEAGATPEAIALAVEAIEAVEAKVEAGRAAARERKRRQRANGRDSHVTVTGQDRDSHATPSLPLPPSPQTPQPPTPTHPEITPRARKGTVRGCRLPEDWTPRPEDMAAAVEKLGVDRAADELAGFHDYWRSVPGAKGLKLDWDATFRNRIRHTNPPRPAQRARNERPDHHDIRADNRAVWSDILADRDGPYPGGSESLRLAGGMPASP